MVGRPPGTAGERFTLDGQRLGPTASVGGLCCFSDGTTDGRHNYAVRQDSTLLEPIGSRPLAQTALYRFTTDWTSPEPLFPLAASGVYYGVAFDATTQSLLTTRQEDSSAVVERWSLSGTLLGTVVEMAATILTGIAVDPADHTIWAVRAQYAVDVVRLENFDWSGRWLTGVDVPSPDPLGGAGGASGAEFAVRTTP
jgi:hypothetical protein